MSWRDPTSRPAAAGAFLLLRELSFITFMEACRRQYPETCLASRLAVIPAVLILPVSCLFREIGAHKASSICLVASRCYKSLWNVEDRYRETSWYSATTEGCSHSAALQIYWARPYLGSAAVSCMQSADLVCIVLTMAAAQSIFW